MNTLLIALVKIFVFFAVKIHSLQIYMNKMNKHFLFIVFTSLATATGIQAASYQVPADTVPVPQPVVLEMAAPGQVTTEQVKKTDKTANLPGATLEIMSVKQDGISHAAFDSILQQYVSAKGRVNYKGLKAHKSDLDAYCQTLSENPVQEDWSREEQMVYWINAYNAFTLQLIVTHYPIKSILNLDGGKTWDVKRIKIGGEKYSLNNIENDILRPLFKDARIHFAINCAAKSCPPLLNRAYTAKNLETDLDARTKAFINDPAFNQFSAGKASVSKIFEWYAVDFGNLNKFLNRYVKQQLKGNTTVLFMEYDWGLNE